MILSTDWHGTDRRIWHSAGTNDGQAHIWTVVHLRNTITFSLLLCMGSIKPISHLGITNGKWKQNKHVRAQCNIARESGTIKTISQVTEVSKFGQKFLVNHIPITYGLTHWGRDKMDAISQTPFSNVFSWIKMYEFRLRFHWSLFPRVQLTIFQHWFR